MRRRALAALALALAAAAPGQAPLYWRDPDGKPAWSAGPRKTPEGRDYVAVFKDGQQSPQSSLNPQRGRHILYYRNPMGLPDTSPVPKKDSMGMDYQPVFGGGQDEPPGTVEIAPGRLQTLGVRTEPVELRAAAGRTVRATGLLQFDERRLATVTTKVAGWIEHLSVAATGDPVRRGQVLASLYAPDLVASENEYLVGAAMGGAMAAASLERLRALDVPEAEIARLRHSGRAARNIAVVAGTDGVVVDKPVQQGMRVEAGEALYRTADLSDMWLIADVEERDLAAIHIGGIAHATFVAFPGRVLDGRVDFISPALAADTRTARVRIVLPNQDGALRASMFAAVAFDAAAGAPVATIPGSSVLDDGTRQMVLVDRGGGRFEPRRVHLGARGDDRAEVLDGVRPGERVVTGANFLIDAESNLRAALQGFAAGAAGAAP